MNADFRDGYCSLPMSNSATRRASTAMCYLDAGMYGGAATSPSRRRPTYRISCSTDAASPASAPRRWRGKGLSRTGGHSLRRRNLLARPADAFGHWACGASARAGHRDSRRPARRRPQPHEPSGPVLRSPASPGSATAGEPAHPPGLMLSAVVRIARAARKQISASTCRASRRGTRPAGRSPISARCCGSRFRAAAFRSLSQEPYRPPLIEFNFLDDERDLRRLMHGFRWVVEFLSSDPMRPLWAGRFRCASRIACAGSTG